MRRKITLVIIQEPAGQGGRTRRNRLQAINENDFLANLRRTLMLMGALSRPGQRPVTRSSTRRSTPRLGAVALCALGMGACQHVPPAPIDPVANGLKLQQRQIDTPAVESALQMYGLAVPADGRWTLDQLTVAAWTLRTDIATAQAQLAAARTATELAGRRPSPGITSTFERVTNADASAKPWVIGASVGLVIETADKRDIRVQRSLAEESALQWQIAQLLWQARTELSNALLDHELTLRALTLDQDELALRRDYLGWIDTRLRFGAATTQDRLLASEALTTMESQLELDRAASAAAAARIAAAVGVGPEAWSRIEPIVPDIAELPEFGAEDFVEARAAAIVNRMDVQRTLAEYEMAEQDLRAAVASQYPDIVLGPGYLVDQADRKITLSLDLPAFLSNRSEATISNAIAARTIAASRFDDAQSIALAQISASFSLYGATRAALQAAATAEQSSALALAVARRRLAAGAADRGEVVAAQIDLAVRQRATLDTRRRAVEAIAALQDSIQRPLFPQSSLAMTSQPEQVR
jgi:cobalt-zinc-cadmium efflux system outer membrane protein